MCVSDFGIFQKFQNFESLYSIQPQISDTHTHIQTECPVFYQYYCIVGVLLCICMFATVKGGLTCSSAEK